MRTELITKLNEKGLSPSSVKIYVRNLEKLNGDNEMKNLNFLKDVDKIIEKLEKYRPNTKRTYLISIVSCLGVMCSGNKPLTKLHKIYQDKMMEIDGDIKSKPADEKSDNQKENWVNWGDVENTLVSLKDKIDVKKKTLNEVEYNRLLDFVILSLYVYQAPRRNSDYLNMYIVKSLGDANENDKNYFVYDTNEFVFNAFKTAKKEGQVVIKVSNEMSNVIKMYLKYHPLVKGKALKKGVSIPFLVFFSGEKLHLVNAITRILNKIFGKRVGSSMLRASYLTGKYGEVKQDQAKDAKEMSHSVRTAQSIYTKVD